MFEKLVVVTRMTRLAELIRRFHSRGHAQFYVEHAGGDFAEYRAEDVTYRSALDEVRKQVELGLPVQFLDRSLVPTYHFAPTDVVLALGQDGLVANVAKYVGAQPLIGVNPDPERYDGILLPWKPGEVARAITSVLEERSVSRSVTIAMVTLNDGQRLLAFNDLFIGPSTHGSARYRLRAGGTTEAQSSSGVLVSTGAGSTGWISSVFNMAAGVTTFTGGRGGSGIRLEWEDPRLLYAVREPFISRHSTARIVAGYVLPGAELQLESLMPSGGVIFSDGIESDFLQFNTGATATVRAATERARLVVKTPARVTAYAIR
jgi:NAD kinase